eukprot:g3746.t1
MASSSTTGQNIFTEPIDHFIFAGALVVFVFVTVVAERTFNLLRQKTGGGPVYEKLTTELMVMGLCSFVLIILQEIDKLQGKSFLEPFRSMITLADVWLTCVGVIYVLHALVFLARLGRSSRRWVRASYYQQPSLEVAVLDGATTGVGGKLRRLLCGASQRQGAADFHLFRRFFQTSHGLADVEFDFAKYLQNSVTILVTRELETAPESWLVVAVYLVIYIVAAIAYYGVEQSTTCGALQFNSSFIISIFLVIFTSGLCSVLALLIVVNLPRLHFNQLEAYDMSGAATVYPNRLKNGVFLGAAFLLQLVVMIVLQPTLIHYFAILQSVTKVNEDAFETTLEGMEAEEKLARLLVAGLDSCAGARKVELEYVYEQHTNKDDQGGAAWGGNSTSSTGSTIGTSNRDKAEVVLGTESRRIFIRKLFDEMDTHGLRDKATGQIAGDGLVSFSEFRDGVRRFLGGASGAGLYWSDRDVRLVFDAIDKDRSGKIEPVEFERFYLLACEDKEVPRQLTPAGLLEQISSSINEIVNDDTDHDDEQGAAARNGSTPLLRGLQSHAEFEALSGAALKEEPAA